jgi:hypothetical protein
MAIPDARTIERGGCRKHFCLLPRYRSSCLAPAHQVVDHSPYGSSKAKRTCQTSESWRRRDDWFPSMAKEPILVASGNSVTLKT